MPASSNKTSQAVHKHRRNLAAKAAQMAEQEAERYFIAGLAARRAQGRKPSRQESEILNRFGTKIK